MSTSIPNAPALRDVQEQALSHILSAYKMGYRNVIVQAPTGTGKTLLGRHVAESFKNTLVGVPTIALQDQYAADLLETGDVAILKGKARYTCDLELKETGKRLNVLEARCQFDNNNKQARTCDTMGWCTYLEARKRAQQAKIAVLSLPGMLAYSQFAPDFFEARALHIIDEAHKLEDAVRSQFSISKSESEIRRQFGKNAKNLPPMPEGGTTQDLLKYLKDCVMVANERIEELKRVYDCPDEDELYLQSETSLILYRNLHPVISFKENITALFQAVSQDSDSYVTYIELVANSKGVREPHITSKPVHLQKLVQGSALGEKNLFMSATLVGVDDWAKSLGIENYVFIDVPSSFPAQNRKVFFTTIGDLNTRNVRELVPAGCEFVRKLVNHPQFKGKKALIHTPSYEITELVANNFRDNPMFLCSQRGDPDGVLKRHITSTSPTVLVGPAFKEGIDLKEDLCRLMVVWKCAYKNPNDPLIIVKRKVDPSWEKRQMIADFIQQIGRGVRSKDDWATTYVLDGNLLKLLRRNKGMVPVYIWESFQGV